MHLFLNFRLNSNLSEEELGLALLGDVLDLGLGNSLETPVANVVKPNNVIEVAANSGKFGTLLQLLRNLGLDEDLKRRPQVTIFAPSDDALMRLGSFSVTEEDLKRHLIAVKLPLEALETGPAFTLSGQVVNIVKNGNDAVQIVYNGSTVNVIQPDIQASNGIIHLVDGIIA